MRKILLMIGFTGFFLSAVSCANTAKTKSEQNTTVSETSSEAGGVIYLTKDQFKKLVFDYEKNKTWKFEGKVPAIVDFYADWCGPCKMLSPHLVEIQKEYGGKIQIYKVNTDNEKELASTFGIQSLPTLVFIPMVGEPQAAMGYRPKEDLVKMVTDVLKVKK